MGMKASLPMQTAKKWKANPNCLPSPSRKVGLARLCSLAGTLQLSSGMRDTVSQESWKSRQFSLSYWILMSRHLNRMIISRQLRGLSKLWTRQIAWLGRIWLSKIPPIGWSQIKAWRFLKSGKYSLPACEAQQNLGSTLSCQLWLVSRK